MPAPDSVKVLIAEKNGVELEYHQEYVLGLDTVLGIDLSSIVAGQQLQWNGTQWSLVTPAVGSTIITPEYFSSDVESSTTSNSWVSKLQATTNTLPLGKYKITYSSELSCDEDEESVEWKVEVDGTVVAEQSAGCVDDDQYHTASGHIVMDLPAGTHTVEILFSSPEEEVVRIRRARISVEAFV